jgi:predicted enzyme related to lactoylglutathione lyase
MTSDLDRARSFYGDVFGWTSEASGEEYGGYVNFSKDGHLVAGCMAGDGTNGVNDIWSIYLATADAEALTAAARANGGDVIVPAMAVGPLGTMAVLVDPGQASIGAWQPAEHKGFGEYGEPGTPSWFELHTRDYDAAVAWYRTVFGWKTETMSDTDEFRYTTLGSGDDALAGIMDASAFLPEGVPAHWSVYFGTDDTDKSLEIIVDLGGAVEDPAEDTPYGRLATATDPMGGRFKLLG